jgi:hypothetical protein
LRRFAASLKQQRANGGSSVAGSATIAADPATPHQVARQQLLAEKQNAD